MYSLPLFFPSNLHAIKSLLQTCRPLPHPGPTPNTFSVSSLLHYFFINLSTTDYLYSKWMMLHPQTAFFLSNFLSGHTTILPSCQKTECVAVFDGSLSCYLLVQVWFLSIDPRQYAGVFGTWLQLISSYIHLNSQCFSPWSTWLGFHPTHPQKPFNSTCLLSSYVKPIPLPDFQVF